jgi:hypothetical protein
VWDGKYEVDPTVLFDRLRGFAHVSVLADKWAAFKLTDAVERSHSCFDGAVRLFWPGFSLSDAPFQHRLFMGSHIRSYEEEGFPLQDHLFRMLAAVASYRYTEGAVIRDVRQALVDDDRRKVDELRTQVKSGSIEKGNLELQLLEALETIDQLSNERDRAKADLAAQQAAWSVVQQAMAQSGTPETAVNPPAVTSTVRDAVDRAKAEFSETLVFLDSACDSASDSPYKDPARVFELFEALDCVATEWREKSGKLGRSWNDALAELGIDYKDQVSQTSKGKWSDDYKFLYNGEKRLFEKHITLGAKQADKCISVHWYRDDNEQVLVIGHCGRHLTNMSL